MPAAVVDVVAADTAAGVEDRGSMASVLGLLRPPSCSLGLRRVVLLRWFLSGGLEVHGRLSLWHRSHSSPPPIFLQLSFCWWHLSQALRLRSCGCAGIV